MLAIRCGDLSDMLQLIASEHPSGLRHADFVTKLLEHGYVNHDRQSLSKVVHAKLAELVTDGVLVRSEDALGGSRQYHLPAA